MLRRFPGKSRLLRLSLRGLQVLETLSCPLVMGSYTRIHPKSRQPLWPCLLDKHSYTNARVGGSISKRATLAPAGLCAQLEPR